MVKFGKKFFFDTQYVKKNRTTTIIIIATVVLVILTTFFITSKFYDSGQKYSSADAETYESISIKMFETLPYKLSYFKKLENVKSSNIIVTYPDNFPYGQDLSNCDEKQMAIIERLKNGYTDDENIQEALSCVIYTAGAAGEYPVTITIGKINFSSTLKIIDDEPPILFTHDLEIFEDETYDPSSFVDSCEDNSLKECSIDFLNTSIVNYSNYKEPGDYQIKIVAKDPSENQSEVNVVNLKIKKIIYHTVAFNSNGGNSVKSETVREGETFSPDAYPTKSGYSFLGWYYNGKEWNPETPIESDITLTAKWEKISTGGGGGYSGGGGSTGGGGSSNTCKKYSDFYGEISIYDYQINGGSPNDCMEPSGNKDEAEEIASSYVRKAEAEYRNGAAYGYPSCSVHILYNTAGVSAGSKYHVGYLIEYTVTSDCAPAEKYQLKCTSTTNCYLQ